MEADAAQQKKVEAAMRVQEEFKTELLESKASVAQVLLDTSAEKNREDEKELETMCQHLFLTSDELRGVIEKGGRGEASKQILAKIGCITQALAAKAKITFGEKRYMEGLLHGLAEQGEHKQSLDDMRAGVAANMREIRECLADIAAEIRSLRTYVISLVLSGITARAEAKAEPSVDGSRESDDDSTKMVLQTIQALRGTCVHQHSEIMALLQQLLKHEEPPPYERMNSRAYCLNRACEIPEEATEDNKNSLYKAVLERPRGECEGAWRLWDH